MSIALLALDLDGTMLDRESRLSPENRQAVAEAMAAGVEPVLVTGRSWRSARPFYEEMALTGPAICYLGALVVEGLSNRVLSHRPLTPEVWDRLKAFAVSEGISLTACVGTDQAVADGALPGQNLIAADTAFATCSAPDFVGWEDWNPYTVMAPDLSACVAPPLMAAVYGERAVGMVQEAFPGGLPHAQFELTDKVAGETVLHIWHSQVDKGLMLAELCRSRGLKPEQVAAIGDAPMDLSMIRYAGVGVAVPEAHPVLKASASWVSTPAEAIRRILNERSRC